MIHEHNNPESSSFHEFFPPWNEDAYHENASILQNNSGIHYSCAEETNALLKGIQLETHGESTAASTTVLEKHIAETLTHHLHDQLGSFNLKTTGEAIAQVKNNVNAADDTFHKVWHTVEAQLRASGAKPEEIKKEHDQILQSFQDYAQANRLLLNEHMQLSHHALRAGENVGNPNFPGTDSSLFSQLSSLAGGGGGGGMPSIPQIPNIPQFPQHFPGESMPKDIFDGVGNIVGKIQMPNEGVPISDQSFNNLLTHQGEGKDDDGEDDELDNPHTHHHHHTDNSNDSMTVDDENDDTGDDNSDDGETTFSSQEDIPSPTLHLSGSSQIDNQEAFTPTTPSPQDTPGQQFSSTSFPAASMNVTSNMSTQTASKTPSIENNPSVENSNVSNLVVSETKKDFDNTFSQTVQTETIGSSRDLMDQDIYFARRIIATIASPCAVGILAGSKEKTFIYCTSFGDIISDMAFEILNSYPQINTVTNMLPIEFLKNWVGYANPVTILGATGFPFTHIITDPAGAEPLSFIEGGFIMPDIAKDFDKVTDLLSKNYWLEPSQKSEKILSLMKSYALMKYTIELKAGRSGAQYINLLKRL